MSSSQQVQSRTRVITMYGSFSSAARSRTRCTARMRTRRRASPSSSRSAPDSTSLTIVSHASHMRSHWLRRRIKRLQRRKLLKWQKPSPLTRRQRLKHASRESARQRSSAWNRKAPGSARSWASSKPFLLLNEREASNDHVLY